MRGMGGANIMAYGTSYWNELLETLDQEQIRQLQLRKFRRIFCWAWDNSAFHRRLYDEAGITPEDIKTFEDLSHVPKTDKSMLRDVQCKEPFPYGEALCVPLEEVTEFRQTSGTTGQPVYQPHTWQDWEWWAECWSYILWAQGYRPSDRVFIPFGYNVFVAFWAGHYAADCKYQDAGTQCERPSEDLSRVAYFSEEQQGELSEPQTGSFFPLSAALIMAAAHPTPLSTVMASTGQLSWQAPHSMHASW